MKKPVAAYSKPDDATLRSQLTAEQYAVTQKNATEPPFRNAYWDEHRPGIYVDITTGEPLFVSTDKFDSGCGWPSFSKPIDRKLILADEDKECTAAVAPIQKEMDDVNTRRNELKKKQEGKKDEDIPTAEKNEVNYLDKKWEDLKNRKNGLFADYAAQNKVVRQLIDLALLQNGMLKGEALNNFVKRSIDLIK